MFNHEGFLFSCILIFFGVGVCLSDNQERKVHIVYMGPVPRSEYSPSSYHHSILNKVVDGSSSEKFLVRSYGRKIQGFAAKLTANEAQELASMEGVFSVFPSTTLGLQTTRSWDFMGFHETVTRNTAAESDVIIGVIDTGIWPESASFGDAGLGPVPKKWKGVCEGGRGFTCNKKIIGARYYSSSAAANLTARDEIGHGSHAASIAAGNKVNGVNFYGLAQGTARGAVPSARIAVYKVCEPDTGCDAANILAAFDDAIADGVHIITISIGSETPLALDRDAISIGSFHAMKEGIVTVQSAGNGLCGEGTVTSIAPWVITVGASSTDRRFVDKIILGNGTTLIGSSINSFASDGSMFPLVYGKEVSSHCSETDSRECKKGCIDSNMVKGKIVLCDLSDGTEAYNAGAMGVIVLNPLLSEVPFVVPFPSSSLNFLQYSVVKEYVKSTKNPLVKILRSETDKDFTAPTVASFSTCGPNVYIPEIMKPDVTAPGVDILAAYSPAASPSDYPLDKRQAMYNIVSGTSISCPHVAGVAAYIKSFHPDWSPSAIKSAIMTTAWPMNKTANPVAEFSYGSGHIKPVKAVTPGLVYEADEEDYIKLLCGLGLGSGSLGHIAGDESTCGSSSSSDETLPSNFNYPSITFRVSKRVPFSFKFRRTVTNVGYTNSIYRATVIPHHSITIQVQPQVLSFKALHERKSFELTIKGKGLQYGKMVSASLAWSDGVHYVRTPIIAVNINLTSAKSKSSSPSQTEGSISFPLT